MKTADFVKKILTKAGVTHEGEIGDELPDEIATSADNALLTIAAATNNHPQVKKVYFAQAFNGLDAELNDLITEWGLSDEIKTEIERAGGSTKRAVFLARKIKELSEKAKPEDKTKADALASQVVDLNKKLATEIEKQTQLKTTYDNDLKQIRIQTKLNGMLGSYKTMFDDLDPAAKEAAISAIINKNLQDSDADFTFDEKGNLSLLKKDGTNLFGENHTLITPQSFIDKSLSKILKVTDSTKTSNTTQQAKSVDGQQQNSTNTALKSALAESLQAYESASKNGISV